MKTYIGIDPGQKGAIAIIDVMGTHCNDQIVIHDMPLLPDKEIDSYKLKEYLLSSNPKNIHPWFCILEKAQAMPLQSSNAGFTYGVGYGEIKSVLKILEIPYMEIRPQIWKKHFSLSKAKKDTVAKKAAQKAAAKKQAVAKAMSLFPSIPKEDFYGPEGGLKDGRAEALLMAEFGRSKR